MTRAMRPKTDVPGIPNAPMAATASMGPNTKPLLPPMEKRLKPVPLEAPETLLAKRAPSGWNRAAPTPLRAMAAKMAQ